MKKIFLLLFCLGFLCGKAQEENASKIHLTASFSRGIGGLLENNHSGNVFFSKYTSLASFGIRKELWEENNFISVQLTYANRGTRKNYYQGNSFLPDSRDNFNNEYIGLHFTYGIYMLKGFFLKESMGIDYLFSSNQYDLTQPHTYRGYYKFTPSLETAIGTDFKLGSGVRGSLELVLGATLLKTRYYFFGPKLCLFLKSKDTNPGYWP